MRRLATTAIVLAVGVVLASAGPVVAQADANGPVTVDECVGPHVSSVVQGDYMRHIPDRVISDTPAILESPGGQTVGSLTAGTSYTVVSLRRGYALLRATRFSKPFAQGQTVGWVRVTDLHDLMPRNCV